MTLRPHIELWTDFNYATEEGWNASTVGAGGGTVVRPEMDERVVLFDGEGNSCEAVVVGVRDVEDRILVYTLAEPETWRAEEAQVEILSDLLDRIESARQPRESPEATKNELKETKVPVLG